ncbi:AlpA family transcriptional regulator [Burkholderia sp. WP9]|uniref:helix-turn-helix transcriptional regulator n=1 Tax=Pseudomonadota TaxID=1224 RepID=UPI000896CF60|nr:AlpA family phage regulatory protein [Burkholderia sp. WP9]SEF14506.1 transcriptional regulator, AlpA family [Burkholderia sp. WP9]
MAKRSIALSIPETGFLRLPQVLCIVGFSASTLWRGCASGTFPKPVKLSVKVSAWRVEDVRAWIAKQGQSTAGAIAPGAKASRAKCRPKS